MKKVVVTGASGFIGKFLVPHLVKKGLSVKVLVRTFESDIFPSQVEQYIGDLTQPDTLKGLANDIDWVFHLGGYAHAWQGEKEADLHQQVNLLGTQNLLNECLRAGIKKFIYFSSIKAVGDTQQCIDESWDMQPTTHYGIAKREAEKQILAYNYIMDSCILRLALVYGPGMKGNLYQMLGAIDKAHFPPIPPVNNQRSLVSVYDVCQAAYLAASQKCSNGRIYYVTDKESYSTYQIYTYMRNALGKNKLNLYIPLWVFKMVAILGDKYEKWFRYRFPFNSQTFDKLFLSATCNSFRIQNELGYKPEYSLKNVLPEIVETYRKIFQNLA